MCWTTFTVRTGTVKADLEVKILGFSLVVPHSSTLLRYYRANQRLESAINAHNIQRQELHEAAENRV
jgi:hypothetical protein